MIRILKVTDGQVTQKVERARVAEKKIEELEQEIERLQTKLDVGI